MFRFSYFSFYLIIITLLTALSLWLDTQSRQQFSETDTTFYQQPSYIIENIIGLRVAHEKTIQRDFYATKMLHFLDHDLTQLEHIRFKHTEPNTPLFRVFADQAVVHNNGKDIFLTDNVTVIRGHDEDHKKIIIETDRLHLVPDEHTAKTNKPVTISRFNTTIHATGLEFDNQTGKVELLSRVRAVNQ